MTIQSVETALRLLETVAAAQGSGLSELSRRADLSVNQTFRQLMTLETCGYVVRDQSKGYWLASKLYLLGQQVPWPHDLLRAAAPALDELAALSGETVLLAVRQDLARVVIDARPSRFSLRVEYQIGSRLPLYVGGMGVALLAFSPPEVLAEVLRAERHAFTEQTLTDADALSEEVARVRASGVRISRDDYSVGEFSVAAPILGPDGRARGALNIAGFTARLNEETEQRYIGAVQRAARQVSESLSDGRSGTSRF